VGVGVWVWVNIRERMYETESEDVVQTNADPVGIFVYTAV